MGRPGYRAKYHPGFFDTLDKAAEGMTDKEFTLFWELFNHEVNNLSKNPYRLSRECKYGNLKEAGNRTISFHSKLPRIGTGDLRIIFKIDEDSRINYYLAIGKRINDRPRPADDLYSIATDIVDVETDRKQS